MTRLIYVIALALLIGCRPVSVSDQPSAADDVSWWQWHAEKRGVDIAVGEAMDAPGNGDYEKAVAIIRASSRPQGVKNYQIGGLVIAGIEARSSRPAKISLQKGLELIEQAATQEGEGREIAPNRLRLIFERGAGRSPNNIPVDPVIANCWRKLEASQSGDPASCIALRRQRLPKVGTP